LFLAAVAPGKSRKKRAKTNPNLKTLVRGDRPPDLAARPAPTDYSDRPPALLHLPTNLLTTQTTTTEPPERPFAHRPPNAGQRNTLARNPADPAATEHGREAARSVVDRVGGKMTFGRYKPPQAAFLIP